MTVLLKDPKQSYDNFKPILNKLFYYLIPYHKDLFNDYWIDMTSMDENILFKYIFDIDSQYADVFIISIFNDKTFNYTLTKGRDDIINKFHVIDDKRFEEIKSVIDLYNSSDEYLSDHDVMDLIYHTNSWDISEEEMLDNKRIFEESILFI